MNATETKTWEPSLLCAVAPVSTHAHPSQVGFLAVQGATGGLRSARPRNTEITIGVQQSSGAYGISGSAASGSLMADALVPAGVTASGVPPRGRPV